MTVEGHGPPRDIAVRLRDGAGPPVVWLGGFRSDMTATKASALDEWAEKTGRRFVRFDYGGHGASGGRFEECTISSWLDDARAVIDAHADEAPVLVGSSMGGWIACLAARERARRGKPTAGLVLIAPALDFTEELLWANLPEARRRTMEADGFLSVPSEYDVPSAHAFRLLERLPAEGTVLTFIADGDHRLSRPGDIARLVAAVAEIA